MRKYHDSLAVAVTLSDLDIQELLLGRMKSAALQLITTIFEQDVQRLCGQAFSHKKANQFRRAGSQATSVVVAGAKHPIKRPRVRSADAEVPLPSYETLKSSDILDETMQLHMINGVSTRDYSKLAEQYEERFGISKSTVSRAFKRKSRKALDDINGADLSTHRFVVLLIDGVEFAGRTILVAVGITDKSEKIILGLKEGASENTEVAKDLLANLISRNFTKACRRLLICLDGAKALKKACLEVFGKDTLIQRCYLHKIRNLMAYLPDSHHSELKRRIKLVKSLNTYEDAKTQLNHLQEWLDGINNEAAASLREVGDEILTVHKLGITGELKRSLISTNLVESLLSVVRRKSNRVTNWNKSSDSRMRWVASALESHKPKMRRVKGVKEMEQLIKGLNDVEQYAKVS